MKIILFILFPFLIFPQHQVESEIDSALIFAKKGIYWILSNLDSTKNRMDRELISDNRMYASVRMTKEIEGIKIESRGIINSTEVVVKIYRSDDFLESEGYLKRNSLTEPASRKRKKS